MVHARNIGGIFPTVVWPSDVDRKKAAMVPLWDATDRDVARGLPSGSDTATAWRAEYAAWVMFSLRETPLFGASNEWDMALDWERRLAAWQDKIAALGVKPSTPVAEPPNAEAADDNLKWIVGGVIAVAASVALVTVVAPLVSAGASRLRK